MMTDRTAHVVENIKEVCFDIAIKEYEIVCAIIQTESAFDPWAVRFEPNFMYFTKTTEYAKLAKVSEATERMCQRTSWGLGQLMGATARNLGVTGPLTALLDPVANVFWTCALVKKLLRKYPLRNEAISAYNAGIPIRTNADYVAKVLKNMEMFKC